MQPESLFIVPYASGEKKIIKSFTVTVFILNTVFYSLQGLHVANEKNTHSFAIKSVRESMQ